jgi:hypothetical protein
LWQRRLLAEPSRYLTDTPRNLRQPIEIARSYHNPRTSRGKLIRQRLANSRRRARYHYNLVFKISHDYKIKTYRVTN